MCFTNKNLNRNVHHMTHDKVAKGGTIRKQKTQSTSLNEEGPSVSQGPSVICAFTSYIPKCFPQTFCIHTSLCSSQHVKTEKIKSVTPSSRFSYFNFRADNVWWRAFYPKRHIKVRETGAWCCRLVFSFHVILLVLHPIFLRRTSHECFFFVKLVLKQDHLHLGISG